MYLSKLEIVGFKSFAQKTSLKFTGGISAVVGPNGCGKTNIVDAIRWVLGEQKTSVLRSDVMENVIFNGTKHRKPLSMAEVTLTIENTKGILPTEFSEVTITRRLFRSGESEYLLNKAKCRLKDIVDLFMDTGLGSDSYSVIELKMVEAILSGRAEERRALFEEAAGIKKYKLRRKEAAKKLENVFADLTRVQDILDEVRKNVNSLSRQAQKTRRYNTLMTEFKELEIKLLDYQLILLGKTTDKLNQDIAEQNKQKIKSEFELSSFEEALSKLKTKFDLSDTEYQLAHNAENNLIKIQSEKQKEIAVDSEKLASLDKSKERISEEIQESEEKLVESRNSIEKCLLQITEKKQAMEDLQIRFDSSKIERDKSSEQLREIKTEVDKSNEQVYSLQSLINNFKSQINRSSERKLQLERKIQGSFEESHRLQSQIDDIDSELDCSDDQRAELNDELEVAEQLLKSEKERQTVLQGQIDNLKIKLNENKNLLSSKKTALEFLKSMLDTNETAKFLIKSDDWSKSAEKTQLAEAIAVDDKYRTAVLSALNYIGDFFYVETTDEAEKAIELLKKEKKGKTSVISKELANIISGDTKIAKSDTNTHLADIIRTDDQTKRILLNLLGNCIIADDYPTALQMIKDGKCDCVAALTGEFVHKSGYIFGGSTQKTDSGKLGKKEKMDGLKKDIAAIENEIKNIQSEIDDLNEELSHIDIHSINLSVRTAEQNIKNFEQKISQTKLRRQALEQSMQIVSESNLRIEDEIEEILKDLDVTGEKAKESEIKLQSAKQHSDENRKNLADAETLMKQSEDNLKAVEIEIAGLRSELSSIESEKRRLEEQIRSLSAALQKRNEELLQSDSLKLELADKIQNNQVELADVEEEISSARAKRDFLLHEKNSLSEQISQHNDSIINIRKICDNIKESIHRNEVKLSEYSTQLNLVKERLIQDYQIEIEQHTPNVEDDFAPDDAKLKITDLKSKLSSLGNVNFLALDEFEKESERLNFYENQVNDLFTAEKTLRETIEEINHTAEKHFADTFEKIHANFKMLFKTLFGEDGEAELKIDHSKLLETDIEIMAKPPNKRPNSIEQLSGGEKTLTAIALLFAIYLVKPSPFCILDEVDAPLDDANVEKFVKLIKEFSYDTQFLIVSHNKKTMTAADTLYGVTMQEVGVSKTVSVSLNHTEETF